MSHLGRDSNRSGKFPALAWAQAHPVGHDTARQRAIAREAAEARRRAQVDHASRYAAGLVSRLSNIDVGQIKQFYTGERLAWDRDVDYLPPYDDLIHWGPRFDHASEPGDRERQAQWEVANQLPLGLNLNQLLAATDRILTPAVANNPSLAAVNAARYVAAYDGQLPEQATRTHQAVSTPHPNTAA